MESALLCERSRQHLDQLIAVCEDTDDVYQLDAVYAAVIEKPPGMFRSVPL